MWGGGQSFDVFVVVLGSNLGETVPAEAVVTEVKSNARSKGPQYMLLGEGTIPRETSMQKIAAGQITVKCRCQSHPSHAEGTFRNTILSAIGNHCK